MMKPKIITFEAQTENVFEVREKPIPAIKMVPKWWKDVPKYSEGNKLILNPSPNITVKKCAPVLDVLGAGYIITLWADLFVEREDSNSFKITWSVQNDVVEFWSDSQLSSFNIPPSFSKPAMKYLHGWNILTPPGWSTMFFHPVGYDDLPIRAISGIVDTDILTTGINCPFFLKENFSGIIPKGTPMVQLLPFKRETWQANFTNPGDKKSSFEIEKLKTKIVGSYSSKKAKKDFN